MGFFRSGKLRRTTCVLACVAMVGGLVGIIGGVTGIEPAKAYSQGPGIPDVSWGGDGSVGDDALGGSFERVVDAVVDSQRRLVVLTQVPGAQGFAVSRRGADGTPDYSFGGANTGIQTIDYGATLGTADVFDAVGLAINSAGNILVAGTGTNLGVQQWAVVGFTRNGDLLSGFGGSPVGIARGSWDSVHNFVTNIAVDRLDRILLAGYVDDAFERPRVARLDANGGADTSFAGGISYAEPAGVFGTEDWRYTDVIEQPATAGDPVDRVVTVGLVEHAGGAVPARAIVNRWNDAGQDVTFSPLPANAGGLYGYQSISEYVAATSVTNMADGGLAVGLSGSTYNDGGGVLRLDRVGSPVSSFGSSGFSNGFAYSDVESFGEHIFVTGFAGMPGNLDGLIGSVSDIDGTLETTFAPLNVPHVNSFDMSHGAGVNAQDHGPVLAVDFTGVPVVAHDNDNNTFANRFVGFAPPDASPGTKVLFTEDTGQGRAIFGMSPEGGEIVPLRAPSLNASEQNPGALLGSRLIWQHTDGTGDTLYSADASDGSNSSNFAADYNSNHTSGPILPAGPITSPNVVQDIGNQYVGALVNGCVTLIALDYSFFDQVGPGGTACGYSKVSMRPGDADTWIGVKPNGELWFGDHTNGSQRPPRRVRVGYRLGLRREVGGRR